MYKAGVCYKYKAQSPPVHIFLLATSDKIKVLCMWIVLIRPICYRVIHSTSSFARICSFSAPQSYKRDFNTTNHPITLITLQMISSCMS